MALLRVPYYKLIIAVLGYLNFAVSNKEVENKNGSFNCDMMTLFMLVMLLNVIVAYIEYQQNFMRVQSGWLSFIL